MSSSGGFVRHGEDSVMSRPGTLWFETATSGPAGSEGLLFSDPLEVLTLDSLRGSHDFFAALESRLGKGFYLAGWLSYEAGYGFEPQLQRAVRVASTGGLLGWFGVYREPRRFIGDEVELFLSGQRSAESFALGDLSFDCPPFRYREVIETIRERIAAGDVYQINFTGRYRFSFSGSPLALFEKLSRSQPSAYSAMLNTGDRLVLSVSPELFFRCRNGIIETMPMKGTAPRGETPEEDAAMKQRLMECGKNRAENLMIVDLLRNDLGRICMPGSVETADLFALECYPSLYQLVSTVRGKLRRDVGLYDIFRALFPSGSVTGAPKIKAMELIGELETAPRGIYTGTMGFMEPSRDMVFNVAIRTIELSGNKGVYGSGSGIVWDSDASEEYRECMLKAKILDDAVPKLPGLFETMLWAGRYLFLEEHLERIRRSAAAFEIPFDEGRARMLLESLEETFPAGGGRFRVRLGLSAEGQPALEHEPFEVTSGGAPLRLALAGERISSLDRYRLHKTTSRALFDRFYRLAAHRNFDEVLFLNERDEVAEAAISNVIILKDSNYYTPPVASGILDGTFRRYFLHTRINCSEKVLFQEDLLAADAIYVCNSLRGMRRAVFDGTVITGNG
ncbi:MAG: aminodeoxychorismate synthase component I [Chlorobium sp.]|uniref:aminodeoxychorismate synthase component I n=1 Tax=Chlorobium sp. TaxID=1095 RepID=UPI0025C625B4|nr:aminodeoxychorismate synthase component I [Chlorobium sp.]MCF8383042.1 aminodeoxychorismate synthase component I [Chlorobium sp.]